MSVSRGAIALYLDDQFSSLATAIGQNVDPEVGYKPDIDNALRKLGKRESELATATVEDAKRDAAFALGEYFAARRLWRRLGDRVDHTMGETSFKFDGQRKQAKEMMDDAQKQLAALGYDVSGEGWGIGTLNLDWLEPEPTR